MIGELFVSNLPSSITEVKLRDLFARHGQVEQVKLITDTATGQFKGYGFVRMAAEEAAITAIEALNGLEIEGKTIGVRPSKPTRLYVGNLPEDATTEQIKALLEEVGEVISVEMETHGAAIRMKEGHAAQEAVRRFNGYVLDGSSLVVRYYRIGESRKRSGIAQIEHTFHTRLYVGDLTPTTTERELHDLFKTAGTVVSIKVLHPSSSQAFAFVEMALPEEAKQAIEQYNSYALHGSRLIVYSVPPRSHPRSEAR